ncbi:MAG: hypothetical protein WBA23_11110 [Tunicatimonas sp.]|uniref:hypothetical protein n=1 Tax=Tunicatimonas sp. TaxID=1940096 RepID=UPI003C70D130
MKQRVYLGVVDQDFELDDEVREYFQQRDITILDFVKNFGIIKLGCFTSLEAENLEHVTHLELDSNFTTQLDD